jgi:hypothetical protein
LGDLEARPVRVVPVMRDRNPPTSQEIRTRPERAD